MVVPTRVTLVNFVSSLTVNGCSECAIRVMHGPAQNQKCMSLTGQEHDIMIDDELPTVPSDETNGVKWKNGVMIKKGGCFSDAVPLLVYARLKTPALKL